MTHTGGRMNGSAGENTRHAGINHVEVFHAHLDVCAQCRTRPR